MRLNPFSGKSSLLTSRIVNRLSTVASTRELETPPPSVDMACRAELLTKENFQKFLSSFDTVLADCDGVIWRGDAPIPGTPAVCHALQQMGKKIFYVTNNSTKSRNAYVKKFADLGFPAKPEQVYGTAAVIASYLKATNFNGKAYCIGTTGLQEELTAAGIEHIGFGPDVSTSDSHLEMVRDVKLEDNIRAVIVGFDPHISFLKLLKGASYLNREDVQFFATNMDERFPIGKSGIVMPGTGTLVTAVQTVSRRKPLVIGKPHSLMFDAIRADHGIDPNRTIMVGDNCHTDILLGKNCSLSTLLVMSGVTTMDDLHQYEESSDEEVRRLVPDFYVNSLGDLVGFLDLLEGSAQVPNGQ